MKNTEERKPSGILTKKHTEGIAFEWGDDEVEIEMIHKIALREGFGNMLAEGGYGLAKIIGGDSRNIYKHVYGMQRDFYLGLYELALATSTRGADHLRGSCQRFPPKLLAEKGIIDDEFKKLSFFDLDERAVVLGQYEWTLVDCLERCKCAVNTYAIACPLPMYPFGQGRARLLSAAMGKEWTPRELDMVAERVYNLERAFNIRCGANRKHDRPPKEQIIGEYDRMLDWYYALGWNEEEVQTRTKLEELDLKYVADEVERNQPYPDWDDPPLWHQEKYPHDGNRAKY